MLTRAVAQRVVLHHANPRHSELPAVAPKGLSGWTAVGVTRVVVDKVVAREGIVGALGLVEHRDVRLDPAVIHQPVQHLGRAVAGIGDQPFRPQLEAVVNALDHGLGGGHLGLTRRRRGLHVDNDRVLHIDEIIGAISIDRRAAPGGGPARRRIDGRDELRLDRRGAAESSIVEGSKVLRDCSVGLGVELSGRLDPALAMSVRHDQAGIDGEALAADKPFSDASPHCRLEQFAQEIIIAAATMTVLRESRVIRHVAVQAKPTEPPIGEVQMDLVA